MLRPWILIAGALLAAGFPVAVPASERSLSQVSPAATAAADSPFAGLDLTALAAQTPGVTRNTSKSAHGKIWVDADAPYGGGMVRPDRATSGKTVDGDWLLVIPLDAGGPLGVHTVLVYRWTGSTTVFVGSLDAKGGGLAVSLRDGHLYATAPLYAKHDQECCPSRQLVARILYDGASDELIAVTKETVDLHGPTVPAPAR